MITIHGIEDIDLKVTDSYPVELNEMPGTDPRIKAAWKMTYNDEFSQSL